MKPLSIAISLISEVSVVLFFSILFPFLIRYFLLPSSIHVKYPLNVVFSTCDHDLHSVCSFPSATLEYGKNDLFSQNVAYYLNVNLKFADVATTTQLGLFQNVISMSDENGKQLKRYIRAAYIKEPGLITKLCWFIFFPFYLSGFFHDYSTLSIEISDNYMETASTASNLLVYTLQNKFANIESAELVVTARFGLIRHLLYYWSITSYCVIFAFTFMTGIGIIAIKWVFLKSVMKNENLCQDIDDIKLISCDDLKETRKTTDYAPKKGFEPDEYIPDNVDEMPKNEVLHNAHRIEAESVRKRK